MSSTSNNLHLLLPAWLCVALALLIPHAAEAAAVGFELSAEEGARQATVDTATRDGIAYVPLSHLVNQLGGQTEITSSRATVNYGQSAALVDLGQAVVSGSQQQFRLSQPVLEGGGDAWIAVDDVAPFFKQAFGATVARVEAPAAAGEEAEQELLDNLSPPQTDAPFTSAPALTGPVVVILDAGHGGDEVGVRGVSLEEKTVTLNLAQRIAGALQEGSGQVRAVLTRTDDTNWSLLDRANRAIQQRGRLLVSLHASAALSDRLTGIEVFYPSDRDLGAKNAGSSSSNVAERFRNAQEGRALAEAVSAALSGREGTPVRGLHAIHSPLLERVPMPGILIEAGYLSNPEEEAALGAEDHLNALAQGIADGIRKHLGLAAPAQAPAPAPAAEAPTS